ncbi:MAG: penicillin-binding protein [Bacteroidetes bacterium HGW-Bacteroidetes-21]|jgi:beta-lactam-binding protein with PASTA domain|nr:MAG: penicillin-binding protein [Bacteroidetes bacterium HGW-Bacteroidetes-21]
MSFISKILNRKIIFHLLGGFAFLILVAFITIWWMKYYTHHGEAIVVPDFTGYTTEEAFKMAEDKDLLPQILDSAFFSDKEPGTVVDQYPKANHKVKRDRLILFTINSDKPDNIEVPDLIGISVRQATADAELMGFRIGKLSYVPDISTTVVYMTVKGKKIKPGSLLPKGSLIDLTVGRGTSQEKATIPSVTGVSFAEAEELLLTHYLNPGTVTYDNTVKTAKDSAQAKVWKQYPRPSRETEVSLGTYVDMWLTTDKDLIPEPLKETKNEELE